MDKWFIFAGFILIYPAVHEIILLTEMKGKTLLSALIVVFLFLFKFFIASHPITTTDNTNKEEGEEDIKVFL